MASNGAGQLPLGFWDAGDVLLVERSGRGSAGAGGRQGGRRRGDVGKQYQSRRGGGTFSAKGMFSKIDFGTNSVYYIGTGFGKVFQDWCVAATSPTSVSIILYRGAQLLYYEMVDSVTRYTLAVESEA